MPIAFASSPWRSRLRVPCFGFTHFMRLIALRQVTAPGCNGWRSSRLDYIFQLLSSGMVLRRNRSAAESGDDSLNSRPDRFWHCLAATTLRISQEIDNSAYRPARHCGRPLYPEERNLRNNAVTSLSCHKWTHRSNTAEFEPAVAQRGNLICVRRWVQGACNSVICCYRSLSR
jgi:hypothetical protein